MSETYVDPKSPKAMHAPEYFREIAIRNGKKLLCIVWEDLDNYISWSVRPYVQGYGCDGTTDPNIHLIASRLCGKLGLDYRALYEQAYKEHDRDRYDDMWLLDLDRYEAETVIPDEVSERTLKLVLHDLGEVNNHSLVAVLTEQFTLLGYDVSEWWDVERE